MAAIDDLKAAQAELSTEVSRIAGEIDQLLTVIGNPGASDADVKAATDQAKALTAALKAASDKSDAAVP